MAEFSDWMENAIINLMRSTNFTGVAAYVALFTAVTGLEENNPTAEVSGGAYARQLAGLGAPSDGVASNANDITFPTATADWGIVTHVALVDHATNTTWGTNVNVLMWSPADVEKTIGIDDIYQILATKLVADVK